MWDESFIQNASAVGNQRVIQVWHEPQLAIRAAKAGFRTIFSPSLGPNRWYLDYLDVSWEEMYLAEPLPDLAAPEREGDDIWQDRVMGGEGCMWGETVDPSDWISTVYPRMSAIAERLWSPKQTRDIEFARWRLLKWRCQLLAEGFGIGPVGADGRMAPDGFGGCGQVIRTGTPPPEPYEDPRKLVDAQNKQMMIVGREALSKFVI